MDSQEQLYSIDNISIKEYFLLYDTSSYDIFIDTINPSNNFNGKICSLDKLTFDEVKYIKNIFMNANFDNLKELIVELYHLGSYEMSAENEYLNTSIFDLFRVKNYLQEWIIDIINTENTQLAGIPDEKLIALNANEKLKPVNHLLTKIRLAEMFGKTPNEIGRWKYTSVFTILVANKISAELQKEYSNMK